MTGCCSGADAISNSIAARSSSSRSVDTCASYVDRLTISASTPIYYTASPYRGSTGKLERLVQTDFRHTVSAHSGCEYNRSDLEAVPMKTRREMLENCLTQGWLVAGVPMAASQLLAFWQDGEKQAGENKPLKPTPSEALGPVFKKVPPNTPTVRVP